MIYQPKTKDVPQGGGRVASNLKSLRKALKRMTPTGSGISHGPLGTAYIIRGRRGGGSTTGAASWL